MPAVQSVASTEKNISAVSLSSLPFVVFEEVLQQGNPSVQRVRAVANWALSDVASAPRIWSIVHRALIMESWKLANQVKRDVDEEANVRQCSERLQFLWYVVDALVKHIPHVYILLISPHLAELVEQCIPWGMTWYITQERLPASAQNILGGGGVPRWCVEMIRSWSGLLPLSLYQDVYQRMTEFRMKNNFLLDVEDEDSLNDEYEETNENPPECCSEQVHKKNAIQAHALSDGNSPRPRFKRQKKELPVSLEEWQQLQEDWDALYFMVKSVVEEGERMEIAQSSSVSAFNHLTQGQSEEQRGLVDFSRSTVLTGFDEEIVDNENTGSDDRVSYLRKKRSMKSRPSNQPSDAFKDTSSSPHKDYQHHHHEGEENENDDEYVPDFVPGAHRRELPVVDTPWLRTRRDARRRQREDDF